ncbi:hypothetical protein FGO68_gene2403 [Halteria grandinella]|uniref:Uncharacterized protein n=1 Tax=Halteria grandinella TaxID=5974 RepID=A0A8J8NTE3_HALGN|nr:hypothetical protein FGO68_gene2403 [Halteria grandinella]
MLEYMFERQLHYFKINHSLSYFTLGIISQELSICLNPPTKLSNFAKFQSIPFSINGYMIQCRYSPEQTIAQFNDSIKLFVLIDTLRDHCKLECFRLEFPSFSKRILLVACLIDFEKM